MDLSIPGRNLSLLHEAQESSLRPLMYKSATPRLQQPQEKMDSLHITKAPMEHGRVRIGVRNAQARMAFVGSPRTEPRPASLVHTSPCFRSGGAVEVSARLVLGRGDDADPARTYPPREQPPRGGRGQARGGLPVLAGGRTVASAGPRGVPSPAGVFVSCGAGHLSASLRPVAAVSAKPEVACIPEQPTPRPGSGACRCETPPTLNVSDQHSAGKNPSDLPRCHDSNRLSCNPSFPVLEPIAILDEANVTLQASNFSSLESRQSPDEKEMPSLGDALWAPLDAMSEQKVPLSPTKPNQGKVFHCSTLNTHTSIPSTVERTRRSTVGVFCTTPLSPSLLPQGKAKIRHTARTPSRLKNSDDTRLTKETEIVKKRSFQIIATRTPGATHSREITPTKRKSPLKAKYPKLFSGSSPRVGGCATARTTRQLKLTEVQLRKRKEDLRRELYAWNRFLEQKEDDCDAV